MVNPFCEDKLELTKSLERPYAIEREIASLAVILQPSHEKLVDSTCRTFYSRSK